VRAKEPFEKVVAEHGARVLRVCRVLLGSHDAEDAWSETFLAALRAYPELPPDANVEAWLVTIAHRKAIDALRSAKRQPVPVEKVPIDEASAGPGPANGAAADAGDLWQAVRTLPDKQRQAIAYHYVADLPYAEIAAILGGSTDAARRAAADGIKSLRKIYPAGLTEGTAARSMTSRSTAPRSTAPEGAPS
jgi:RNA polymerase sigma factor (sigma-70 family)